MYQKFKLLFIYIISNLLITVFVDSMAQSVQLEYLTTSALALGSWVVFISWWHRYQKQPLVNWCNVTVKNYVSAIGLMLIMQMVTQLIVSFLPEVTMKNQNNVISVIQQSALWSSFLTVVIFGPIAEELLFRHLFLNVLFPKQQLLGSIVSATLFALSHSTTTVTEFVVYFMPGVTLAFVYKKYGLENACLAHMTSNAIAFLVL